MRPAWAPVLRHLSLAAAACALLFAVAGYFGPMTVDNALHKGILENIVWRPDSPPEVDARFRGQPVDPDGVPDYFRVWLWNVTNLAKVRQGAKPKMVEVGPLTYVKSRVRLDPRWDRSGRVTVKEWDYHVFQPELSGGSPDDVIVTLNLPLLGVLEVLHAYSASVPAVQPLLAIVVGILSRWQDDHVDRLFTKRTAGELIWGYEDLLLQRLSLLLGPTFVSATRVQLLKNESEEEVRAHKGFNLIDTGWRPAGRQTADSSSLSAAAVIAARAAGKFERAYGSVHGGGGASTAAAAAATGGGVGGELGGGGAATTLGGRRGGGRLGEHRASSEYDEQQIWNMEMESGWSQVTAWGPNCTEPVRGTDAFQFRPGLDRNSVLRVWIAELFRSAQLLHVADEELHGIRLLRFVPDPQEAELDPCHHQFIRGLANVTVAMAVGPNGNGSSEAAHGVPILMSLPHYCLVDEVVSGAVEGMSCDPYRHGIFLDVEPTSGITMRAAKRLQLSSQLTDSARATLEPSIGRSLILPIFWAEEASEISAVQAAKFRGGVYRAKRVARALRTVPYPAAAAAAALAALAGLAALVAARPVRRAAAGAAAGGPAAVADDDAAGVNGAGGGGGAATAGSLRAETPDVVAQPPAPQRAP